MVTIRGIYDGNAIRPLPAETLLAVTGEIPVLITFLEASAEQKRAIVQRMRAAREAMQPLGISVTELIEDGRER